MNRILKMSQRKEANSESSQSLGTVGTVEDPLNLELYLRDSLIKAFMIIFTNEKSQHLLLNIDLIDIAFNCMCSSQDITLEAQRNVARLISMIFKFPKVQRKVMQPNNEEVIIGIPNVIEMYCKLQEQFSHMINLLYIQTGDLD
mmetsp:Transcript_15418/g.23713  ORF Transcript_15418/g.23713 Transcript_15418/m.23713 type:complete len:144 (+) Transcript_15418:2249-2680(+)